MPTIIEIALRGCVNGVPVEGVATGELDRAAGSLRAELTIARPPLHWDPALGLMALVDVLLLEAARPDGPEPADVAFATHRAVLRDDQRRELGGSVASVRLERADGRLAGELQFLEARFRLEPTERAKRVEAVGPAIVVPREPAGLHAANAYALDTDFGHRYSLLGVVEGERDGGVRDCLLAVDMSLGPVVREPAGEALRVAVTVGLSIAAATRN